MILKQAANSVGLQPGSYVQCYNSQYYKLHKVDIYCSANTLISIKLYRWP